VAYRIHETGVARVKRECGPRDQIASDRRLAHAMRDGRPLLKIMSVRDRKGSKS
jgi:hypothetical protein